jgi:hypothetical protein
VGVASIDTPIRTFGIASRHFFVPAHSNWRIIFAVALHVAISERLRDHDIQLVPDRCDVPRLRALQRRGELPGEMLLLISFRQTDQRRFAPHRRDVLLVDLPAPGVDLPYIWNDVEAAISHAV